MNTASCLAAVEEPVCASFPASHLGMSASVGQHLLPTDFVPFSLDHADAYGALLSCAPNHPLAYSLGNLWGWAPWMELESSFAQGLCWLRCRKHGVHALAPVGPWDSIDWAGLRPQLQESKVFYQVPEHLARLWEAQVPGVVVTENRDYWEYLYNTEDLAQLTGNRYHTQRNHVNAYVRENGEPDYRTLDMTQPEQVAAVLELATLWYTANTQTPTTTAEREALQRLCAAWARIPGLVGGGIYLNNGQADELVAFSIGSELGKDEQGASTLGILFEKGRPGLRGAFPVMTRGFARTAGSGHDRLNRAEDMGDPGMRKAKTLFRPVDYVRMCTVEFTAS